MKWLALFWVYRREALAGWNRRKNLVTPMNVTVGSEPERAKVYQEFFEEALTRHAGRPLLTQNEARARFNLPPVDC